MAKSPKRKSVRAIDEAIQKEITKLEEIQGTPPCYSLLLDHANIDADLVDDVYDDLRGRFGSGNDELLVVVHSGGGDIDAAYNLVQLFRRYGAERLIFAIPRWAKSAATLLVCGGDLIQMTPVAELGPVDPRITWTSPLEQRSEQFSPLDISSTLALIRDEYATGHEKLAQALTQRLQFPLTLGSFKKSLEHGEQYLRQLLSERMLSSQADKASEIAKKLTQGYASHGACIVVGEAQSMGLKAQELDGGWLDAVWTMYRLAEDKHRIEMEKQRKKMLELIKELPKELIDQLPPELRTGVGAIPQGGQK